MRKALVIGIDDYKGCPLDGCVNDANAIQQILGTNADGSPNFDVQLCVDASTITRSTLKKKIEELFASDSEVALLYFSGHGCLNTYGGYIVTPDFKSYDEGVSMDDIMKICNSSIAKHKIIILDCCYSGKIGNPDKYTNNVAEIANGVTILAACREDELATETDGHGVFTSLLVEALEGQCADLVGKISPGSIYAFIDRALGAWAQRPLFKTNVSSFISLRTVPPTIDITTLRKLTIYFPSIYDEFKLDPTFEDQVPGFNVDNVKIFKDLQKMVSVGLVKPVDEEHMYFAAMNRKSCKLTALGAQYWKIVKSKRI